MRYKDACTRMQTIWLRLDSVSTRTKLRGFSDRIHLKLNWNNGLKSFISIGDNEWNRFLLHLGWYEALLLFHSILSHRRYYFNLLILFAKQIEHNLIFSELWIVYVARRHRNIPDAQTIRHISFSIFPTVQMLFRANSFLQWNCFCINDTNRIVGSRS